MKYLFFLKKAHKLNLSKILISFCKFQVLKEQYLYELCLYRVFQQFVLVLKMHSGFPYDVVNCTFCVFYIHYSVISSNCFATILGLLLSIACLICSAIISITFTVTLFPAILRA